MCASVSSQVRERRTSNKSCCCCAIPCLDYVRLAASHNAHRQAFPHKRLLVSKLAISRVLQPRSCRLFNVLSPPFIVSAPQSAPRHVWGQTLFVNTLTLSRSVVQLLLRLSVCSIHPAGQATSLPTSIPYGANVRSSSIPLSK